MTMSDGALWDHVHSLFGIGDYHDDYGTPFWKYRALEAHKVRARRVKAKVSTDELATAADYCKAHGIDIRYVGWLYEHLNASKKWHQDKTRKAATAVAQADLDEAIAYEAAHHPDGPWLDRLIRADRPHSEEVYQAWKQWRASNEPATV